MNLELLQPGHRIRTRAGREAEVLPGSQPDRAEDDDGIRVAYIDGHGGPFGIPVRTDEEDVLGTGDVEALLGAAPPSSWREQAVIVLHYVPESAEGSAEYRAETLQGIPNDVKVQGSSEESARAALNHLLGGLFLMGFRGTVLVEDGSGESGEAFERFEVEV